MQAGGGTWLEQGGFRRAAAPSAWVVVVLPSSAGRHLKVAVAGDEDQWEVGAATDLLPIPLDGRSPAPLLSLIPFPLMHAASTDD